MAASIAAADAAQLGATKRARELCLAVATSAREWAEAEQREWDEVSIEEGDPLEEIASVRIIRALANALEHSERRVTDEVLVEASKLRGKRAPKRQVAFVLDGLLNAIDVQAGLPSSASGTQP
jgi:hypothetical protein